MYVTEYLEERVVADSEVAQAILEEVRAHQVGPLLMRYRLEGASDEEAARRAYADFKQDLADRPPMNQIESCSAKLMELLVEVDDAEGSNDE